MGALGMLGEVRITFGWAICILLPVAPRRGYTHRKDAKLTTEWWLEED